MIAAIAVMAERAHVRQDGKLDLTGVYNCRYVPELPGNVDLTLAMRFDVEPLDFGVHQNISVHVVDEDDAEMVNLRASPVSFNSTHAPGLPLAYDLIVPLNIHFPRDGTWIFDVRVNDRTIARVPLRVEQRASFG
jgi:hypothetical protein